MFTALFARLHRPPRPAPPAARGPSRVEVCPPELLPETPRWRQSLREWITTGWSGSTAGNLSDLGSPAPGSTPLAAVRLEFVECLDDVRGRLVVDLTDRIRGARSMRELWHLRTEVFSLVSCQFDETEAGRRLARLNRHFPARTAPSGFGKFDALIARIEEHRR